ncbi:hypothetical protein TNCV_2517711 [Trichonephila clavipes]|nr:hypothetical protein TNCV_2517711 [Trichonephila clavipes]
MPFWPQRFPKRILVKGAIKPRHKRDPIEIRYRAHSEIVTPVVKAVPTLQTKKRDFKKYADLQVCDDVPCIRSKEEKATCVNTMG